jgi:hypothetical protein
VLAIVAVADVEFVLGRLKLRLVERCIHGIFVLSFRKLVQAAAASNETAAQSAVTYAKRLLGNDPCERQGAAVRIDPEGYLHAQVGKPRRESRLLALFQSVASPSSTYPLGSGSLLSQFVERDFFAAIERVFLLAVATLAVAAHLFDLVRDFGAVRIILRAASNHLQHALFGPNQGRVDDLSGCHAGH